MTEKQYKMVNTNLVDDDGLVYYLIKKDGRDVCQVFGKHTAKAIVTELNSLYEENEQLKQFKEQHIEEYLKLKTVSNELKKENEQLKTQLTDCKEKKQQMKEFFMNSEPIIEQKKLQKLIYRRVINLIDEKIDELQKQYDFGQEHGFCPMHNIMHSINVLKELKQELGDFE